ncbi:MAG: hypothetical protein ACXVJK_09810, partial [Candidatus Aminicenantales bacterium]
RKIDDIERDLAGRISQEKEAARKQKEDVEREFLKERDTLSDYRTTVRAAEEERNGLLLEARKHFDKVVSLQAEIEGLARATVDEIKKVTEVQQKIEDLREKTAERAGFLKTDLRDRFGIVADALDKEDKPLSLNLDEELEKLRRIKELLAIESAAVGLGSVPEDERGAGDLAALDNSEGAGGFRIPEIQELVAEMPAAAEPRPQPEVEAGPEPPEEEPEAAVEAALESCRRTEPANGNGEIHYFQKDDKILIDGESLFSAVEKTIEEARRLSVKLGQTESPKDQFFIKQELINWQEGLRALFLRVIKMTEKKIWGLPAYTDGVLNAQSLRGILEQLSIENWSNPEEFAAFTAVAAELRTAYFDRITPRGAYLRALKKEITAP